MLSGKRGIVNSKLCRDAVYDIHFCSSFVDKLIFWMHSLHLEFMPKAPIIPNYRRLER